MEKIIYNVLNKFDDNGFKAYIVGGYVRDHLLGKKTMDIDICTNARPKDVINIFKEYNITPLEYGNVILELANYKFEITTFRKEITYKNNRKPEEIIYIDSLEKDIERRDFTINSICMDKNGKIIDLLNGKKDLRKKLIKVIGNSNIKIEEDSLRIMRAIRFAVSLNFKLDEDLKAAIIKNKDNLKKLSYSRKKEELNKIFSNKNKKYAIKLLKELDLLEVLELKDIENVLYTNNIIGMWATITDIDYSFTKTEKDLIKEIKDLMDKDLNNKKVLYRYGAYPISIVCDLKKLNKKRIMNTYERLPIKDRSEIKITSEEICELLKKEPDSFLKEIYTSIEDEILSNKLKNINQNIKDYIFNKYMV